MADPDAEPTARDDLAWVADLPPGTTVLVAGPPMTGKRKLMYRLVAADRDPDWARTIISTRKSGDTVAAEYRELHPEVSEELLSIVDCVSDQLGSEPVGSDTRRYTHDPGDLTGIGIHVSELMRGYHADPEVAGVNVGLHTLSTMLMYTSLKRVFQFLHVVVGRISTAGFRGAFVMDERPGSQRLDTLSQPFDGLVEVRHDQRRELRVRGIDQGPRNWEPF